MTVYTYPSYHDESESKSPGYEPRPMRVWFDPATQVYHGEKDFGDFKVPVTHELGEKTLDKLKLAVDWHGPLPDSISESLANDSADLQKRQTYDQTNNQRSPLVFILDVKDENTHKSLCLYEAADAGKNVEVNFDIATGMFDIQESNEWNGHNHLYTQGVTPEFGTSSLQEVHRILDTFGKVPPEINTWINDMSKRYPRLEEREDPELERYRIIDVMLEKHEKWLDGQEGGQQASFAGKDVSGDHFRGRNLEKVDFTGCDMREIIGRNMVNFSKAIMPDTNWQGMKMKNMSFKNVDLDGANFKETVLENTHFSGALRNTKFNSSTLVDCGFDGDVKFAESVVVNSEFGRSPMQNATMENATIKGTNFSNIPDDKFTLSGAKLTNCHVNGSDMFQWDLTNTEIQAIIDIPTFTTLNKNNQAKEIDLSFDTGNISAKDASVIVVPMTEDRGTAYIAFLPDENAFIGTIGIGNSCGDLFEDRGYDENGPYERIKFMRSPTAVEEGIDEENQDDFAEKSEFKIPEYLMVKMQRLLDENTKRLASNNTSKEPEHTEENSQGR